jgi:peptide/nickel transport system substrate-binding protein
VATSYWNSVVQRRISRRRALIAAGSTSAAALLIACGGGDSGSAGLKLDDSGTSRQPGTVWFARNDWRLADESKNALAGGIYRGRSTGDLPSHLDPMPQVNSAVPTSDATYQLLMARNRGPGIEPGSEAYATPTGALAETWEVSSDATTYTFTLRQGVKFHNIAPVNGRVMDMDDWKSSHERHLAIGNYRLALGDTLDKVEYPDARHMVWKFKGPFAPMVDRIWDSTFGYFILPKELNADPSIAEQKAIGTNYRILDKVTPSVTREFRKHPEYWGGTPFIERWHEPVIPEYANVYAQFVQGRVTEFSPTARDVFLLRKDAPNTVIVASAISETTVSYHRWGKNNTASMPWKDERVRIALRKSIDYAAMAEFLSNRAEFEANGIPAAAPTHLTSRARK